MKKILILTFFISVFSNQEVYDQIIKEQKEYILKVFRFFSSGKIGVDSISKLSSKLDEIFESNLKKHNLKNDFISKNKQVIFKVAAVDLLIKKLERTSNVQTEVTDALFKQRLEADQKHYNLMRAEFYDKYNHLDRAYNSDSEELPNFKSLSLS